MTVLHVLIGLLGVLTVLFLLSSVMALKRRHFGQLATHLAMALCFLLLGGFFGLAAISVQGYRALTYEQLAGTVSVVPLGAEQFEVNFVFPDGSNKSYTLSGNQLLVDAHILKWKPIGNVLGFHTSYALSRISGRYRDITDEQSKQRTVYSLLDEKLLDIFTIRKKFAHLHFLLDAEYGSASFVPAHEQKQYALMVSTSGLLFRSIE